MTKITIHPWVRNSVIALLWAPVIMILLGAGVGISLALVGTGWAIATSGTIPDFGPVVQQVDPTLALLGVAGALYLLYRSLASVTFGEETIDQSEEALMELRGEVQDDSNE